MKAIFLLVLFSFSALAFSEEIPTKGDVLRAVVESLAQKDLDCIQSNRTTSFKASRLELLGLDSSYYTMTINERKQPVVVFMGSDGQREVVTSITTNEDFSSVTGVSTILYNLTEKMINRGTIVAPRFEKVISKKLEISMDCK